MSDFCRVEHPAALPPEELDRYLEQGWYRIGQAMMACRFVSLNGALRSAIWTRLPLDGYAPRASLRKLTSRVERRYQVCVGPLVFDDEHCELFERYATVAPFDRESGAKDLLFGDGDTDLFDTWEVTVREGGRLVAFSWFDRGEKALQSVVGAYDPDHARSSLGFYTLLREIRFGQEHGFLHHYSGYLLPGDSGFDYKRRVGSLEWLDSRDGRWRSLGVLTPADMPLERLVEGLDVARGLLSSQAVDVQVREYPMFAAPAWQAGLQRCLGLPLVLQVGGADSMGRMWLLGHDPDNGQYVVLRGQEALGRRKGEEPPGTVELIVELRRQGPFHSARAAVDWLARRLP